MTIIDRVISELKWLETNPFPKWKFDLLFKSGGNGYIYGTDEIGNKHILVRFENLKDLYRVFDEEDPENAFFWSVKMFKQEVEDHGAT